MLTALLAVLINAPPLDLPIAFTANFYLTGDSAKKTYYQVYLSSLDGKTRKQITTGTTNFDRVYWQGKDALILVKDKGRWYENIVRLDLKTGSQAIIGPETYDVQDPTPGKYERGRAVAASAGELHEYLGTNIKKLGEVDYHSGRPPFQLVSPDTGHPGKLKMSKDSGDVTLLAPNREEVIVGNVYGSDTDSPQFLDAYNGIDGKTYVWTKKAESNEEPLQTVSIVNWQTGTLQPFLAGLDIDFRPGSRWVSVTTQRHFQDVSILRSVWVNEAKIEDRKTGRSWKIGGLVDVASVSIRKVD